MFLNQAGHLAACTATTQAEAVGGPGVLILIASALLLTPAAVSLKQADARLRTTVQLLLHPHEGRHSTRQ